jgi:hypothetical protein
LPRCRIVVLLGCCASVCCVACYALCVVLCAARACCVLCRIVLCVVCCALCVLCCESRCVSFCITLCCVVLPGHGGREGLREGGGGKGAGEEQAGLGRVGGGWAGGERGWKEGCAGRAAGSGEGVPRGVTKRVCGGQAGWTEGGDGTGGWVGRGAAEERLERRGREGSVHLREPVHERPLQRVVVRWRIIRHAWLRIVGLAGWLSRHRAGRGWCRVGHRCRHNFEMCRSSATKK